MFKTTGVVAGVSSAFLVVCCAQAMAAAPAATDDSLTLEEVTVTAERVTQDLQKVPQFISVKSGAELKAEGKVRVEDILGGVVGLTQQTDNAGQDNMIFMRGITNGAAGVSIVIDGVAQQIGTQSTAAVYRFTSLDVGQVAITRGVQNGAGVSALSGTVGLVTNKPVFENQVAGSVTAGSFKTLNTEGVINLPLSSTQAVRIAASTERRDSYASSGLGEVNNRTVRFRYRWKPSDKLDINASYQEGRIAGTSNNAASTLFTGHWQTLPGGGTLTWTNPYTGVTTTWGQQFGPPSSPSRAFYLTGNVGVTFANNAANIVGVTNGLSYNSTNASLMTAAAPANGTTVFQLNNSYYYPAPACVPNNQFQGNAPGAGNPGSTTNPYASYTAALAGALGTMAPASSMWGCPFNMVALRDGVDWNQRSNPWDDGFRPGNFFNVPSYTAVSRQASVTIDWSTQFGNVQMQPSMIYANSVLVEAARGTSWMETWNPAVTSYRLDSSFTSKMVGALQYIVGLNAALTPAYPDGQPNGGSAKSWLPGLTPWTAGTAAGDIKGLTPGANALLAAQPNGGAVSAWNANCYFVLPQISGFDANGQPITNATGKGVVNNNFCQNSSYSSNGDTRNLAASLNLRYTLWDKLHLEGTGRYEYTMRQQRSGVPAFNVDPDGSTFVYVLPQTTAAANSTTNPNAAYAVPYRMNLSARDLAALANAYKSFSAQMGANAFTFNVQYDVTPSVITYARLATGISASMNSNNSLLTPAPFVLQLPDAKVPLFSGNASANAVARSGMPYEVTVNAINPSTRLLAGEKTRQFTYGLKTRWFDNRVQFNVEGFYNQFTNRALTSIVGAFPSEVNSATNTAPNTQCSQGSLTPTATTPFSIYLDPAGTALNRGSSCFAVYGTTVAGGQNAQNSPYTGVMVTKGVDVDLTWTPTNNDRLDIQAEALRTGFVRSENLPVLSVDFLKSMSDSGQAVITGTNDAVLQFYSDMFNNFLSGVKGYQLANAPKFTVNSTYQHRFRLESGWTVTPRLQLNYTSAKYFTSGSGGDPATDANTILDNNWAIDNGRSLPTVVGATRIWNTFLSIQPPNAKWTINAYVNNVRNTAVLNSAFGVPIVQIGSRSTNDLQRIAVGGNATLGAPRVIGLTLSAQL